MKILILPPFSRENLNENFFKAWDQILTMGIPVNLDETQQASNDGVWLCDKGEPIRSENKIIMNADTLEEVQPTEFTQSELGEFATKGYVSKNGKTYIFDNDFVSAGFSVEYMIHKDSLVTQADIDQENLERHRDYGNGFWDSMINKKQCTYLVLQEGSTVTQAQFDAIRNLIV